MPPFGKENRWQLAVRVREKSLDCANPAFETMRTMIVARK
jgi:hypothetical protein